MTSEQLAGMVAKAAAIYEATPKEIKRAHDRAQRKSWAVGEYMLEHPEASREYTEQLFEGLCP